MTTEISPCWMKTADERYDVLLSGDFFFLWVHATVAGQIAKKDTCSSKTYIYNITA